MYLIFNECTSILLFYLYSTILTFSLGEQENGIVVVYLLMKFKFNNKDFISETYPVFNNYAEKKH